MSAYSRDEVGVDFEQEGVGESRKAEAGGMVVAFERWAAGLDATEMFAGLPDGACQEEHWGYVLKGRGVIRYTGDREDEVISAGQAYYLPPGHVPSVEEGEDLELLEFTPVSKNTEQ
jgi:mannose-6-phosphate isomerase-like protein (cupin superfamily)